MTADLNLTAPRPRRRRLSVLLLLFSATAAAACDIPRDPENTLESVRNGRLDVGVSEAPPWLVREADGEPGGVEAALVRHLAERLCADVRWIWGTPAAHVDALERYEIDLVIGGHTLGSPLVRAVGATRPWYVSTEHRDETEVVEHEHVFLLPPGENGWLHWLDRQLLADSSFVASVTREVEK